MAEGVGFEPTDGSAPPTVFKTVALNHSATTPYKAANLNVVHLSSPSDE